MDNRQVGNLGGTGQLFCLSLQFFRKGLHLCFNGWPSLEPFSWWFESDPRLRERSNGCLQLNELDRMLERPSVAGISTSFLDGRTSRMNDRGSYKSGIQKLESISRSDAYPLPTMKPFESRPSLHSLLRVQTRWQLWNIKPYTSTPLVLLRYLRIPTTKLTGLQSRIEGPPRFQKLPPELCAVLFPCCDTDYGRFGIKKKPGSVASFVILRELKPAILILARMNWLELGARRKATPSKVDY